MRRVFSIHSFLFFFVFPTSSFSRKESRAYGCASPTRTPPIRVPIGTLSIQGKAKAFCSECADAIHHRFLLQPSPVQCHSGSSSRRCITIDNTIADRKMEGQAIIARSRATVSAVFFSLPAATEHVTFRRSSFVTRM